LTGGFMAILSGNPRFRRVPGRQLSRRNTRATAD
jgi:hypothetical protein